MATKTGDECQICMETTFLEDVNGYTYVSKERCCGTKICLECWLNDLKQICPICERDQLDQDCLVCKTFGNVSGMSRCDCGQWVHHTCEDPRHLEWRLHVEECS